MRLWIGKKRYYHIPEVGFFFELRSTSNEMAGHDILTLGATDVDMDFVQQYKSLGVGLESDSKPDGDEGNDGSNDSDNSSSGESDSDDDGPSGSELSDLDNTGMSDVSVLLTYSFVRVTDDHPQKRSKHAK